MVLGHQRPLQDADLFDLPEVDTSRYQAQDFGANWKAEKRLPKCGPSSSAFLSVLSPLAAARRSSAPW